MDEEKTMIPCLFWVPKGFAKTKPKTNKDIDREMQEMLEDDDMKDELKRYQLKQKGEYEELDDEDGEVPTFANELNPELAGNADPKAPAEFDSESEEDVDDYTIKKNDCIIVAGKIEDEFSGLEIYIYEEKNGNMFVHHDLMLSAFPICLEWLGVEPSSLINAEADRANMAIVGSFIPHIEIWDLDQLDPIEPTLVLLGVEDRPTISKKKKGAKKMSAEQGHSDAVVSLSLNHFRKNVLASSSADNTVKIWDLATAACVLSHKVPNTILDTIRWDISNESVLLTGSDDGYFRINDIKQSKEAGTFKFSGGKVESLSQDPTNTSIVHFSFDNGHIAALDIRKGCKPLYDLQISSKSASSVSVNPKLSNMLSVTCFDGTINIYNTLGGEGGAPKFIAREFANQGNLFSGSFCPDTDFLFSCGSAKGEVVVWDMNDNKAIKEAFEIK